MGAGSGRTARVERGGGGSRPPPRDRARLALAAAQAFAEATSDRERLPAVIARTVAGAARACCTLFLLADDGQSLRPAALGSDDPLRAAATARLAGGPLALAHEAALRRVVDSGESLRVPRLDGITLASLDSTAYIGLHPPLGVHSLLVVALRRRARTLGVLQPGPRAQRAAALR